MLSQFADDHWFHWLNEYVALSSIDNIPGIIFAFRCIRSLPLWYRNSAFYRECNTIGTWYTGRLVNLTNDELTYPRDAASHLTLTKELVQLNLPSLEYTFLEWHVSINQLALFLFNHTSHIECWHIRLRCPSSSVIIPQTSLVSFISSTIENHPSNQYQPRSSALKMNKTDKKLVFRSFQHAININLSQSEYRVDNQFWNGAEMVASKPTPNHHEMRRRRCLPQALDARCLLKDQWQL